MIVEAECLVEDNMGLVHGIGVDYLSRAAGVECPRKLELEMIFEHA